MGALQDQLHSRSIPNMQDKLLDLENTEYKPVLGPWYIYTYIYDSPNKVAKVISKYYSVDPQRFVIPSYTYRPLSFSPKIRSVLGAYK